MASLVRTLDVTGRELALAGDVVDDAGERLAWVRVYGHLDRLPQSDFAQVGLRHEDAHPLVAVPQQPHDGGVGRGHVAGADADHLDAAGLAGADRTFEQFRLDLAEAGGGVLGVGLGAADVLVTGALAELVVPGLEPLALGPGFLAVLGAVAGAEQLEPG